MKVEFDNAWNSIDKLSQGASAPMYTYEWNEPVITENKGLGIDMGRGVDIAFEPGRPLTFEKHLKWLNHQACSIDDYPDLSLTISERQNFKE